MHDVGCAPSAHGSVDPALDQWADTLTDAANAAGVEMRSSSNTLDRWLERVLTAESLDSVLEG